MLIYIYIYTGQNYQGFSYRGDEGSPPQLAKNLLITPVDSANQIFSPPPTK